MATPTGIHCPMTLAAMSRGIHGLSEKPLAMNLDEARRMIHAAGNADVVAMIDHEFSVPARRAYAAAKSQAVIDAARLSARPRAAREHGLKSASPEVRIGPL